MKRTFTTLTCLALLSTSFVLTGCETMGEVLKNSSSAPTYDEYGNVPSNTLPDYVPPSTKTSAQKEVTSTSLVNQGASNADTPKPTTVKTTAADGPSVPSMAPTVGQ